MKASFLIATLAIFSFGAFADPAPERNTPAPAAGATAPQEGNPAFEAAKGSSVAKERQTFTHGESKRCESLTGAQKQLCDKEEGTKAEGEEAQQLAPQRDNAPAKR